MISTLANFLVHNDYPLVRLDVAIVVAAMLLIALVLAPLYVGQRQWGRSALEGLLVLLFADFNGAPLWISILAAVAVTLVGWWRRVPLAGPLAVFGAIVLATTIAGLGGRPGWIRTEVVADQSRPANIPDFAILHILLDEQAGVEGIYPDATGLKLRRELRDFFVSRGFNLYGRAYSEHMHTVNAIPAVLNYGERAGAEATKKGVNVGKTAYFSQLRRDGFRINVLQNDFAELCAENQISKCTTYDSSSLHPTLIVPLTIVQRSQLIALKFIALSKVAILSAQTANRAGALLQAFGMGWRPFEPGNTSRTSTVAAIVAFKDWSSRLQQAQPGQVYFAHVLLPHYPHVVRSDCSFLPWQHWELRRSNTALDQRRRTFAAQDRCTLKILDASMRAFQKSLAGKNGVIIVHGDHGSRIVGTAPVTDFVGHFTVEDVIAGHSTLFAIRKPRVLGQYVGAAQPTAALLRDFAATGFKEYPTAAPGNIRGYVMSDRFWRPQRWEDLPARWVKPSASQNGTQEP